MNAKCNKQWKAQYNLGRCYSNGISVEQKDAEAMIWFRKAAEQGHAEAQTQITTSKSAPD
jgi:TPR repeat protein